MDSLQMTLVINQAVGCHYFLPDQRCLTQNIIALNNACRRSVNGIRMARDRIRKL